MDIVKSNYSNYDNDKLDEIKYGLEGLYLNITKIVIITSLAIVFGIFKEYILILFLFNILRFTGFGIHASKSWMCWVSSTIVFIVMPLLCKYVILPNHISWIIALICLLIFVLHAPSDTPKRPLIRKKRRVIYKVSTALVSLIFIFIIYKTDNNLVHNAILASMIIEAVLIHPLTYKIFNIPYNNYKSYV